MDQELPSQNQNQEVKQAHLAGPVPAVLELEPIKSGNGEGEEKALSVELSEEEIKNRKGELLQQIKPPPDRCPLKRPCTQLNKQWVANPNKLELIPSLPVFCWHAFSEVV